MNNKLILIIVVLLIIVGGGYYFFNTGEPASESAEVVTDKMVEDVVHEENLDNIVVKELSGILHDVSGGEGSGVVQAIFENGEYKLRASFADLPEPQGTDFYEGWVVRRGESFSAISTGKAEVVDDYYDNNFSSDIDLIDHDFYVLTIEPDDGDPAPAGHILEGVLTK